MVNNDVGGAGFIHAKIPDSQTELHESSCDCQQYEHAIGVLRKEVREIGYLCCVCLIFIFITLSAVAGITTWCESTIKHITGNMSDISSDVRIIERIVQAEVNIQVKNQLKNIYEKDNPTNTP